MMHEKAIQLAHASDGPPETRDFTGKWDGQHGAILDIRMNGSLITGMFTTYEGTTRHHVADLSGVAVGDLISINALWRMGGSITSWSGQYTEEEGRPMLKLMWRLITEMAEPVEPKYYWMSSFGGAEDFVRQTEGGDAFGEEGHHVA